MTSKMPLNQIQVASPCSEYWSYMAGNATARFCGKCSQFVYDLSELTQEQAAALIVEKEGKLCVRFYKRADGTVMSKDCPIGLAAAKRRMAWLGAVATTILVAFFGWISWVSAIGPALDGFWLTPRLPGQMLLDQLLPDELMPVTMGVPCFPPLPPSMQKPLDVPK